MSSDKRKPEWTPKDACQGFASTVIGGVEGGHDGLPGAASSRTGAQPGARRRRLSVDEYIQGVLQGDRTILGRAITLVESNSPSHMEAAQAMLQ
ncbi:MAG: methylmalonyl Co-A mutase-associated GTPase MeaB, partial [Pseudomonadota bacterium]